MPNSTLSGSWNERIPEGEPGYMGGGPEPEPEPAPEADPVPEPEPEPEAEAEPAAPPRVPPRRAAASPPGD